jgi:hypothetical protein
MDGGIFAEFPYDVACPSGVGSRHDRKHPQPLPSVILTINLRTLNLAPMMEVASRTWQHARVWLPRGTMISSRIRLQNARRLSNHGIAGGK